MAATWAAALRRLIGIVAVTAGTASAAQTASHAYLSGFNEPWFDASNLQAMDAAFGADWTRLQYGDPIDGYGLLYIDGGSETASEMVSYLDANRSALENYVLGGGRLFINAATEFQGSFDLVFGATSTQVDDTAKNLSASAVDTSSELFASAGTSWNGYFFAHNHISFPDTFRSLVIGDNGATVVAGGHFGDGFVMVGGQTNTLFHESVDGSDPFQLRVNELLYTRDVRASVITTPVPEADTLAMLALGMLLVVLEARRHQRRRLS